MKRVLTAVALALLFPAASLPLSAMTTLALLPLWRVIEERYGIESVGHSGPADWCFILIYALWMTAGAAVFVLLVRRKLTTV